MYKGFVFRVFLITAGVIAILSGIAYYVSAYKASKNFVPVACTQEAKICPDGSSVSRTGPNCEFAACPENQMIKVDFPKPGDTVSSPLKVTGQARGNWYFEASFPVKLFDANGKQIAVIPAKANGEWMTAEFVPFEATLVFAQPETATGTLVLKRDNPSGMPQNDASISIPVSFGVPSIKSGIKGRVMLGPTCPVQRIPPDPNCADKPYSTLIAVFSSSDPVHAQVLTTSNADGTFSISLPAGRYIVGAGEKNLPRCPVQEIVVETSTVENVDISCDTGIR